jgi:hypothetical protein
MTTNHVLYFTWNRVKEGRELQALENFAAMKTFWNKQKTAGEIVHFETVMLQATGNEHMPVGFFMVTGDRAKLHALRWENQEFLNLHTTAMMTVHGYGCVDGICGDAVEKQMQRFATLMKNTK